MRPIRFNSIFTAVSFNPRTRMGCDGCKLLIVVRNYSFNPRTRMGCDSWCLRRQSSWQWCFNPRTRMGCDSGLSSLACASGGFNPRTRMGCDESSEAFQNADYLVSIHAPAWGATINHSGVLNLKLFQSTHPHGVRQKFSSFVGCMQCFNPRTRMGCDA
mgnify:FL=1